MLHTTSVRPTEITDRTIRLTGVHRGFVDALADDRARDDEAEELARAERPAPAAGGRAGVPGLTRGAGSVGRGGVRTMPDFLTRNWNRSGRAVVRSLVAPPGRHLAGGAVVSLAVLAVALPFVDIPTGDRLGWYGVALGLFGFWYTVSQLYLTQHAAEAAYRATQEAALNAYRARAERTTIQIEAAVRLVDGKQWKQATYHLREACQALRRVQVERRHADNRWTEFADGLTALADHFRDFGKDGSRLSPFPPDWVSIQTAVLTELAAQSVSQEGTPS